MSDNFFKVRKGVSLEPQPGEPLNGQNGDIMYDDSLNKFRGYKNGSWGDIGGGSGLGINFIENWDAETNADDYNLYNNGAVAIPTSGSGGIATNLTFTRTTTVGEALYQLASFKFSKGAFNCQGMGVSYDFTISEGYKARKQFINFIYKTQGSFSYGAGTEASPSDIGVFIYDVDTSQVVPSDNRYLDGSGSHISSFSPVDITSVNYRIIFHIPNTNASAWDFIFDMLVVGPNDYVTGQVCTLESATMTGFTSKNGSNFVLFSTVKEDSSNTLFTNTAVGGATRFTALKSIKATVSGNAAHSNQDSEHYLFFYNSSDVQILRMGWNSGGSFADTVSGAIEMEAGDYVMYYTGATGLANDNTTSFSLVASHTEEMILSSQSTNNIIALTAYKNAGSVTANTTIGSWTGAEVDTTSSFNLSTGEFTAPETGFYFIAATLDHGSTIGITQIRVNGTAVRQGLGGFAGDGNTQQRNMANSIYRLSAGQIVTVTTTVSTTLASNNIGSHLSIFKISNPQNVASSGASSMSFKYQLANGASAAAFSLAYAAFPLNTTTGTGGFATRSGSQITIQPGTYMYIGSINGVSNGGATYWKAKIRQVSGTPADLGSGLTGYLSGISNTGVPAPISGILNLPVTTTIEMQARANVAGRWGFTASFGDPEVFGFLTLIKLG